MSDGGQDLEPILQDYRNLVDGFREKHADLKRRLDAHAASSSQGLGPIPGTSLYPGPDMAQFVYAYAENQARIFDFLRAHLDSRKTLETLAAEKAGLQSELARFSEQVMILSKAAIDASEEKGRLSLELESSRKETGEARQGNEGLLSRITALENDLSGARQELADRKPELAATLAERDSLREQIESLSAQGESDRARMEGIEATERNLAEARKELEETRGKIVELENRLAEVRAEDENLRNRVDRLDTENRASRERVEGLQAEIDRARANTVPTHQHESVKAERDALLDQGKSQIERILSLEKEIERHRSKFEETINQKVDAEKNLKETEARLQRSEARVEELGTQLEKAISTAREPTREEFSSEAFAAAVPDFFPQTESSSPEGDFQRAFGETEISMFETDPDKVESLALSEDRDALEMEESEAREAPTSQVGAEHTAGNEEEETASLVDLLDSSFGDLARAKSQETAPVGEWDRDDSIFDEIFKEAFPNEPRETVEEFRAAVESDTTPLTDRGMRSGSIEEGPDTRLVSTERFPPAFKIDPLQPEVDAPPRPERKRLAPEFPYPEITGAGMENYSGKRVLLVGGDERFLSDYRHLFGLSSAELVYFPSFSHLERNGVKRHVRDCDMVVVFGAAAEDPGVFRLKTITEDYGRLLVNHPSSGLVSLYHELQTANAEL